MNKTILAFLVAIALCLPVAVSAAGDRPASPVLTASGDGVLFGGCQVTPGDDGVFELFKAAAAAGAPVRLGRFNGRLAGVAVDAAGRFLALTRDGSLGVYGEDPESLLPPDSRWRMLALAWWRGEPIALSHDNGVLRLVRAVPGDAWKEGATAAAETAPTRAVLVPLGDELHLLWSVFVRDLSRGAIRHMVFRNDAWTELPALPLGDVLAFTAYQRGDGLALLASVPHPLGDGPNRILARIWRDGSWTMDSPLDEAVRAALVEAQFFAGIAAGGTETLLYADAAGLSLVNRDSGAVRAVAAEEDRYSALVSLALLLAFAALMLVYCRRSRMLSRLWPGRPADLTSRAAALGVDWLLVSIGMSAYHVANGDMRIYPEMMSLGLVNQMFWINLAVLALYCTVLEGLYGRTPGKNLAGLRVRSALGGPPAFTQVFFRNAIRGLDMFPILFPGLLGAGVALANPRRQRLGDLLAATVVRRHSPLRDRKFVLASASPRRLELLQALGPEVRVRPADIDEDAVLGDSPEETARLLAEAKAKAVIAEAKSAAELVVAADTMVVLDAAVLGKPVDAADARRMLTLLSGRSHRVLTGLTVWDAATGQGVSDVEETEVEFRNLSAQEIDQYVASGDPLDKAGAYGVQSAFLVKQIRGSLSNVAGLPMEKLQGMLTLLDS